METKIEEIWKDVVGYEGRYKVSNLGRVYSCVRKKLFKGYVSNKGYYTVYISKNYNYRGRNMSVHRLVAMAFIPNPENKPHINHKDGVKTNPIVTNLEWCTQSENIKHAYDTGLKNNRGENSTQNKLTNKDVLEIRQMRGIISRNQMTKKYNVGRSLINRILARKAWAHI